MPLSDFVFLAKQIDDWIFDLDNTIYPARENLFARVSVRITEFVSRHYGVSAEKARVVQKDLFYRYGTTMRGLMTEENIEPKIYLDFVHDIDLSDLSHDWELDHLLDELPGKKHIFTNGTVSHAKNILNAYGIRKHFDNIFDIVAADYIPKPELYAFDRFVAKTNIDPKRAIMIEDMAANLKPAAALGMQTVWLVSKQEWAKKGSNDPHIHFKAEDIKEFLRNFLDRKKTSDQM